MKKRFVVVMAALLAGAACETNYEFDPVEAGVQDDSRTPRPKTDAQFLRSVYGDLVDRPPGQFDLTFEDEAGNAATYPIDEEAYLLFVMDGTGDSESMRDMIVAGLVDSEECDLPQKADVADPAEFVSEKFRELLGREPTPYELQSFVDAWSDREEVGPRVVVRAIAGSREYQSQ